MPITSSAKKALRGSKRKKVVNTRRKEGVKTATKAVTKSLSAGDLSAAYKALDKAVKTGVLKKNTAARRKSRLAKLISKSK